MNLRAETQFSGDSEHISTLAVTNLVRRCIWGKAECYMGIKKKKLCSQIEKTCSWWKMVMSSIVSVLSCICKSFYLKVWAYWQKENTSESWSKIWFIQLNLNITSIVQYKLILLLESAFLCIYISDEVLFCFSDSDNSTSGLSYCFYSTSFHFIKTTVRAV